MAFKDHFSQQAELYACYRPTYPAALFQWLAESCAKKDTIWDCGTGNGQAAVALADRVGRVFATDASMNQIENAAQKRGVIYRVAPAERSGLSQDSIDLITVGQALHWFDFKAFFVEVDRVLKPGGMLAVWSYGLAKCDHPIDDIVMRFYSEEVGSYWPPERHFVEREYATIPFPYPKEKTPRFYMDSLRNSEQLLGYLRTWSACKRFEAERGFDPVTLIESEIQQTWPKDVETMLFRSPIYLLVGKKPG